MENEKAPSDGMVVRSSGPYKTFGELRRMESLGEWRSLACYCTSRWWLRPSRKSWSLSRN